MFLILSIKYISTHLFKIYKNKSYYSDLSYPGPDNDSRTSKKSLDAYTGLYLLKSEIWWLKTTIGLKTDFW